MGGAILHISNSKSFHSFLSFPTHFILHKLLQELHPIAAQCCPADLWMANQIPCQAGNILWKGLGWCEWHQRPTNSLENETSEKPCFFQISASFGTPHWAKTHVIWYLYWILHQSNGWITKKRPVDYEFRRSSWCKLIAAYQKKFKWNALFLGFWSYDSPNVT